MKPLTRRNPAATRSKLVRFFGAEKSLPDIKAGDAGAWNLAQGPVCQWHYGPRNQVRQAILWRCPASGLIAENPFSEIAVPSQANEAHKYFVGRIDLQSVLNACPDAAWRLIFALSRYGGVCCPSEALALRWQDVDWERGRFGVSSPKAEEREGHEGRWVPLFPDLRPYFEAIFEASPEGAVHVISDCRDPNRTSVRACPASSKAPA